MLTKAMLEELYLYKKMPVYSVATELGVTQALVRKALQEFDIPQRSKSETAYLQHGKSFRIKTDLSIDESILYGVGIGLYWGEGNKADEYSVRLGNTNPDLILTFVKFLNIICGVDKSEIRFGLQIFNDSDEYEAIEYWMKMLKCTRESFHKKISIIPPQGKGTYRKKNRYGVLQIYVSNKRLKIWLMEEISRYAAIAQW
ncbi:MAG: hypothetical protein ABI602_03220 [Candidatus Saccharibacteria bacterium]